MPESLSAELDCEGCADALREHQIVAGDILELAPQRPKFLTPNPGWRCGVVHYGPVGLRRETYFHTGTHIFHDNLEISPLPADLLPEGWNGALEIKGVGDKAGCSALRTCSGRMLTLEQARLVRDYLMDLAGQPQHTG